LVLLELGVAEDRILGDIVKPQQFASFDHAKPVIFFASASNDL